jgi:hypothetical protein
MTVDLKTIDDDGPDESVRVAAPGPTGAGPTDGDRDAAVRDVLYLLETSNRLQATLAANAALYEESLLAMLDGADPGAAIDGVDLAGSRLVLVDSLAEFERARHRARGRFIAAQFERGMNMKEIGRRWGISRQLAHRFFKESRRDG